MINKQSLVLIGVKYQLIWQVKTQLYYTLEIKQNQENQGYASTLKECIKTEKQASIHEQNVIVTHKYLKQLLIHL